MQLIAFGIDEWNYPVQEDKIGTSFRSVALNA